MVWVIGQRVKIEHPLDLAWRPVLKGTTGVITAITPEGVFPVISNIYTLELPDGSTIPAFGSELIPIEEE